MMNIARNAAILVLLIAATALVPTRAHAQDSALERVHNLIVTGRFTDAGRTLDQWERSYADPRSEATAADRARALYLRGLITTDATAAMDAFLGVVLSYPSSDVAPQALLRLGQGLLAEGSTRRAIAYLERLHNDYPGTDARTTGILWLARAQLADGNVNAACATAREGVDATSDPNLRLLMEIERDRACSNERLVPHAHRR